jgi:beta-phosphoglucomutase-like phosphatase (HAD superfamily)/dTDP-glucose pyrophosphorylase
MNIIIPLGGKGDRFNKEGFTSPKPLIKILNKEMIFYLLDNLSITNDNQIFIVYHTELDKHDFSKIIQCKYPNIVLIPINYQTSGAVETIYNSLCSIKNMNNNKKTLLLDCDTFYTTDILKICMNTNNNVVFYKKNDNEKPIYSYISLDENSLILEIKEKIKISSNANTGAYLFKDIVQLETYCEFVLKNNITFNGEPYTSCVISEMIKECDFYGYELEENTVFSLGTPKEVADFIDYSYVFLFDLDGTLVNTDSIYLHVWKKILNSYNIDLTSELFYKYIHGNSDSDVLNKLLPNVDISKISQLKDELFAQHLSEIVIIEGVCDFFKKLKHLGYSCSIVTNCNRDTAEKIVSYCSISPFIDFIIVGSECKKPKPFADPYIEAMQKYNVKSNKTIIFEDSKSGLLSARLSNPLCIVGITTNYNEKDLQLYGANLAIDNFVDIDIDSLKIYNDLTSVNIKKFIKNSINLDIIDIVIDDEKLKGGFISDVLKLQIFTRDEVFNCVLKLENKNETKLSLMAKNLGLYERENYFYDKISSNVNVKFPKFLGLIKDDNLDTIGILMENLYYKKFEINLNLNTVSVEVSLKIIENMAKLHSKFWNKNLTNLYPDIKKHNDPLFFPKWKDFINENLHKFKDNWKNILTEKQILLAQTIASNFNLIQDRLSSNNLTIIHGDIKSPNIFYDINNNFEPYFLDWQYVANGKGVQDLIFFIIESFDIDKIKIVYPIFKHYYYIKLVENGVNYSFSDFENDIKDALCYFPFFVSIWFGTINPDELIDKNFPAFFIQKVFYCFDMILGVPETRHLS